MKATYKIVFLGNSSVGKTSLMAQYLYQKIEDSYGPTIGLDFVSTTINICGQQIRLQLWDTAGQERFNSLIPNFTRNSFLTVVVYDYTDEESFNRIDYWIKNLVWINDPEKRIKIVIVANKKDLLSNNLSESRNLGLTKAKKYNAKFVETSALTHQGIKELIKAIHDNIEEDIKINPEIESDYKEVINLVDNRSYGCCGSFRK